MSVLTIAVMTTHSAAEDAVADLVRDMEHAWAEADGSAFASAFAEDAYFTNILGETLRDRESIARHHEAIFSTVYRGSTISTTDLVVEAIRDDVAWFGVASSVQTGEVTISTNAAGVASLEGTTWLIRMFHNMVPFTPPS